MKRHRATRFLSLLLALAMLLSLSALPVLADEDEGTGDSGTVEAEVAEAEAQVTEAEADANLAEEEETGTEADESGEAQESDESDETQETGEAQETQESDDSQAADDTDPAADESTGTDDSQTQGTEEDTGDDSGDEDEEIVLTLTSTDEGIAVAAEEDEDGDGDSGSETTVAMIGDVGYTTLADAVEAVTDSTETIITLTANTTVTADITISGTQKIVLDLAGYTVTMGSYVVSVSGSLTIQDSNSSVSVSDTYEVTYSGGSLTATGVAVQVVSGGIVTLASGKVAGKYGLRAWGDEEGTGSAVNSTVKVTGGYVYAQECAVTVQCNGATAEISGGVLETADNAVVAGNGTNGQGGTTITISGGTLIGHIQTSGYVACGIYHPQSGTLNISGGTIYVDGGCGILMRGGTLSMTGGTIITTAASATGMVGDSRVVVDASGVIYDLDSGYYDVSNVEIDLSDNVTINAASGSNAVTVVAENSTYTSGTITVSGGTYSSDVSEYIDTSSCSISLSSDGTGYTVVSGITDVVAKIGEVGYTSLAAAVAAASDGDTITLADDVDISTTGLTISSGKSITLDLNGHTIKAANTNPGCIAVYGGLTLKDNSDTSCNGEGNGKIYTETAYNGSSTGYALIDVVGTFTMESGYIYAVIDNASSYGQFGVGSAAGGDITINGGKIEAGWYAVSGNGNDTTTSSTITINGGYLISTADYAIYHPQSGTLIVNGGTIYGEAGGICMNRGTLTVTGGTITSKGTGNTGTWGDGTGNLSAAALNVSAEYGDVTTTISGGTFTAETNALILTDSTSHTATVSITGGTFSSDVSDYAAEGYAATANSDGTYTVAVDYEAKIGDTTYKTLEAAIAAAKESGESEVTITLLADVETDATIEWSQATPVLTIDLNGHNITKTADSTSGNTFDVFQGTFTLTGSGAVSNENGSSALRIKGSTDSTAENYTVVTIGTDVTLLAKYAMFITPYESSKNPHAYGVVVNIYGTLTATEGYGFYVNGQMVDTSGNVPVVNVYNGAKITASSESSQNDDSPIGIYIAGYAEITIKDGATISGDTGIEIRAGVLTVNGGTITGNATTFSTAENGNGATTVGAGIAVVQHTTGLPMSVTINGGTISGLYGVYEANTQENDT
ncbi:MAG: hypothetical protein LUG57_01580, partial [Oscillospiraceae bacterium]|nr:hypothetical protein [Oscillospiraceae bacterium]